ncbi:hypothetical protein D3C79_588750 [compost metagenome]
MGAVKSPFSFGMALGAIALAAYPAWHYAAIAAHAGRTVSWPDTWLHTGQSLGGASGFIDNGAVNLAGGGGWYFPCVKCGTMAVGGFYIGRGFYPITLSANRLGRSRCRVVGCQSCRVVTGDFLAFPLVAALCNGAGHFGTVLRSVA